MEEIKDSVHIPFVEDKNEGLEEAREAALPQGGAMGNLGWDKYLRLLAAIFGLGGALFASYGTLVESPQKIAERTQSYWDFSQPLIDTAAHEKANRTVGFLFIAVSFALSAGSVFAPPTRVQVRWIALSAVSSCLFIVLGLCFQKTIYSSARDAIERLVTLSGQP